MSKRDRFIVVNDTVIKSEQPVVPATSRGLMYGDGCFETLCAYNGQFFKLSEHLQRLKEGLHFLGIDYPSKLNPGHINSILYELLSRNQLAGQKAVVRLQVWREGKRGYRVDSRSSGYSIVCTPASSNDIRSFQLASVNVKRVPSAALPSKFKFTNGLNYITAAAQAKDAGADDALMETIQGYVSETTTANIFWLKDSVVYTPSPACDLLPGITRAFVLHLLRGKLNVKVKEGEYKIEHVKRAEAAWICNSVKEMVPVSHIDDTPFNQKHPFLKELQECFRTFLHDELAGVK